MIVSFQFNLIFSINTGWTTGKFKWHFGLVKVGGNWQWLDGTPLDYPEQWSGNMKYANDIYSHEPEFTYILQVFHLSLPIRHLCDSLYNVNPHRILL